MSLFYLEFSKIGILFCFSFFLASLILFLSYRVSMTNPDVEKLSAYECGFNPYEKDDEETLLYCDLKDHYRKNKKKICLIN
tara:strand:- start:134 stop:376 length:243 start_codon:yes stop_codon:yes gene_type:complete